MSAGRRVQGGTSEAPGWLKLSVRSKKESNLLNQLRFMGGGLLRGGAADGDDRKPPENQARQMPHEFQRRTVFTRCRETVRCDRTCESLPKLYKSGFDPTVNVRLRHSFNGGHYRRGGLDVVKDAQHRLRRREHSGTSGIPDLLKNARVLDNIDPLAKLAAKR
jgi:hypothetical protein